MTEWKFPMKEAIQCIPEFNGATDELEPFLVQIDHFAEQIPTGESEKPLLNVVLMKLKGRAATFINRIKSEKWKDMMPKLQKVFGRQVTVEEILQQIETIEQGRNECFKDYVDRALRIKECIDEIETHKNEEEEKKISFAERSLKIHFLGGLKNENLKQTAKAHRLQSFDELIDLLNEVYVECEQIDKIEQRLQSCRLDPQHKSNRQNYCNVGSNQYSSNNGNSWNFRNFSNQNFRADVFSHNNVGNQYPPNNFKSRINFNPSPPLHGYPASNQNNEYNENRRNSFYPNYNYNRNHIQYPRQNMHQGGYMEERNYNQQKN